MPSKRRLPGRFIVLDGPDKAGKSTLAKFLVHRLQEQGVQVVHTREPGGTSFAEAIRRVLLDPKHAVHPLAELFLYEAARAQHTFELVRPALENGKFVVCERYTLATLVYQGCGRGLPFPLIRSLNKVATGGLSPDLTLVLDIPESEFDRRKRRRLRDRLENEGDLFRRKVRAGYRRFVKEIPRGYLIDARQSLDRVQQEAYQLIEKVARPGHSK